MSLAEQFARPGLTHFGGFGQGIGVEARIAAQAVGGVEIDDDQVDRPVGLGLHDEPPLEFERGADERCQHHRLAEKAGNRGRISMSVEDDIERFAEPDGATAAIEAFEGKRDYDIVAAFRAIKAIAR